MNLEVKISPAIAFIIIIAVAVSAIIMMESFSVVVAEEMDRIMETI